MYIVCVYCSTDMIFREENGGSQQMLIQQHWTYLLARVDVVQGEKHLSKIKRKQWTTPD